MKRHNPSSSSRGGHQQKRKVHQHVNNEDVNRDAATKHAPCISDDSWSPLGSKLLEKWAWGELSVENLVLLKHVCIITHTYLNIKPFLKSLAKAVALQDLAKAASLTFPDSFVKDLNEFASLGAHGHAEHNCHRDLLQKLPKLFVPEPYQVNVPLLVRQENRQQVIYKDVPVLLPHEWFASLFEGKLLDFICGSDKTVSFWSQTDADDPRLFENPMTSISGWQSKVVPFLIHGDAAPHQNKDSINILSMRSVLSSLGISDSQLLIAALPESCRATKNVCVSLNIIDFDGDTWDILWDAVSWSFNQLLQGTWPATDHKGNPFPSGSNRALKGGTKLCPGMDFRGIVWIITADLKHLALEFGLANHSSSNPCFKCACNKSTIPYNDFRHNAKWKGTEFTPEYYKVCPPTEHKLLQIMGVNGFTFFYDPMHCLEIGVAGHAIANALAL